jgi:PAS domain-containing protein
MATVMQSQDVWSGPYSIYVRRLGGDPRAEFEPVLEALPYGAFVIDVLGRVLCINRRHAALTGIERGMTLEEIIQLCDVRDISGHPLGEDEMPQALVLLDGVPGAQAVLRLDSPTAEREVLVAADCRPVLGADGRVIGVITVAREIAEEVALAMEVRRVNDEERIGTVRPEIALV